MEKIRLAPGFAHQLNDLIDILYIEEYFGFKQSALNYVSDIESFVYTIPNLKYKTCKTNTNGVYYCKYKRSRRTTWYIIFDKEADFYLIKYITNNHTKDYLLLI